MTAPPNFNLVGSRGSEVGRHASRIRARVAEMPPRAAALLAFAAAAAAQHVVPGQVQWPLGRQTYDMKRSSAMMICNSSGRVDPVWAAKWGLVDLDWNGDKAQWSSTTPMTAEEDMVSNMAAVHAVDPTVLTWVYRNGAKALPWHTTVRTLLEDRSQWGLFMPLAGCMPTPGDYVCGPNATQVRERDARLRLRSGASACACAGSRYRHTRTESIPRL